DRIEILVRSAVETHPVPVDLEGLAAAPGGAGPGPLLDFLELRGPVARSAALEALEREVPVGRDASLGAQIAGVGHHLLERFDYRKGVTDYRSTTEHLLQEGGGVCQDFAHVMLGVLRLRGVPCRYVSGYLHVERGGDEPSQSHAWVEAYVAGHGWVGFDPTHDCMPDERYVVVARGRDYDDVPPNRGIFIGSTRETLTASVETRVAPPKDVAGLQEEIGQLDVPVFQEQPPAAARRREDSDAAAQQQQQQ
ncbi:MAG: transglutaminase-like domain-containing protein, partial [Myxococcota bacterium]